MTDFDDGELNCTVTEDTTAGYDPEFFDGTTTNDTGCEFLGVTFGSDLSCRVTNTPAPVIVTVNKEWVIPNAGSDVSQEFSLELQCDAEIVGGFTVGGPWFSSVNGEGDETFEFEVIPTFGGNLCSVSEVDVADSATESDASGCQDLEIGIGAGAECTVVNTVFFEGIPTLSRLNLALLALLLLLTGWFGVRRFA